MQNVRRTPLAGRALRWVAPVFLIAAGFARADLAPASGGRSGGGDFEAREIPSAAAERAVGPLGLDLSRLLANASQYWEKVHAKRAEVRVTSANTVSPLEGSARLNAMEFILQALVEGEPQPQMLFAGLRLERPWGTQGLPGRLAGGNAFARPPGNGAPVNTAPDARMLKMEHKEPWSPTAAAFYRGLVALTMVAIVIVFWLRDQLKGQSRRMV